MRIRQKIGIRLLFASHLKIVQLGDGTGFDDPAAWGTKGYEHVRGALIRTYTNGLHTLTHIRLFSRARFHGLTRDPNKWKEVLRSEYKGDGKRWWEEYQCQEKAEWEEATELGGFRVPAGVTFAAAKQDWLWTTPGRRLSLPDEVWKELGAWLSERQEARYKRDMESRERLVMGNFNALRIER